MGALASPPLTALPLLLFTKSLWAEKHGQQTPRRNLRHSSDKLRQCVHNSMRIGGLVQLDLL